MSVDVSPAALLAGFRSWLAAERGLSRETVRCYSNQAGTFLASLPDPESAVRQLDSGQVTSFMVGYCRDRNVESAKAMATSLRALLRFLHVSGHTPIGLAGAVPGVAGDWPRCRGGWMPRWWRSYWGPATRPRWSVGVTTRS